MDPLREYKSLSSIATGCSTSSGFLPGSIEEESLSSVSSIVARIPYFDDAIASKDSFKASSLCRERATLLRETSQTQRIGEIAQKTLFHKDVESTYGQDLESYEERVIPDPSKRIIERAKKKVQEIIRKTQKARVFYALQNEKMFQENPFLFGGCLSRDGTIKYSVLLDLGPVRSVGRKYVEKYSFIASSEKRKISPIYALVGFCGCFQNEPLLQRNCDISKKLEEMSVPFFLKYYDALLLREKESTLDMENVLFSLYCERGNLADYMEGRPFSELILAAKRMARALVVMHTYHYAHLDLKPENVFMDQDVYLADFDTSMYCDSEAVFSAFLMGTPGYKAPETMRNEKLSKAQAKALDIWAFGLVLFELFHQDDFNTYYMLMRQIQNIWHESHMAKHDDEDHIRSIVRKKLRKCVRDDCLEKDVEFFINPEKKKFRSYCKTHCYEQYKTIIDSIIKFLRSDSCPVNPIIIRALSFEPILRPSMKEIFDTLCTIDPRVEVSLLEKLRLLEKEEQTTNQETPKKGEDSIGSLKTESPFPLAPMPQQPRKKEHCRCCIS